MRRVRKRGQIGEDLYQRESTLTTRLRGRRDPVDESQLLPWDSHRSLIPESAVSLKFGNDIIISTVALDFIEGTDNLSGSYAGDSFSSLETVCLAICVRLGKVRNSSVGVEAPEIRRESGSVSDMQDAISL